MEANFRYKADELHGKAQFILELKRAIKDMKNHGKL